MQKFIFATAVLAATAGPVSAAGKCNKHGAVVEQSHGIVLYLGKSCDATRKGGGTGKWWNAASFLGVMIGDDTYMVREEFDCLPFCESPF